jgi:hypothetical protein
MLSVACSSIVTHLQRAQRFSHISNAITLASLAKLGNLAVKSLNSNQFSLLPDNVLDAAKAK